MLKYSINGRCHLSVSTKYQTVKVLPISENIKIEGFEVKLTSNLTTEVIFIFLRQFWDILKVRRFLRD